MELNEHIAKTLQEAVRFVEFSTEKKRRNGKKQFESPYETPKSFHLSLGDKMILRHMIEHGLRAESKTPTAFGGAVRILYLQYYPDYEWCSREERYNQ